MKIRTVEEIAKQLGIQGIFPQSPIQGYKSDSRKVEPGDLFFAIKGEKTDGHLYIEDVAKRGALAAVVSTTYKGKDYGLLLLYVEDVLESLQLLARNAVESRNIPVIAVTGSIGKTTTKEFISQVLAVKFRVGKTPGNANSQVGLPMAILSMSGEEEVLVLEMGMSDFGHIQKLVSIVPPTMAVITKIDFVHIASFSGIEDIAKAKSEILSHPKTKCAVINQQAMQYEAIRNTNVQKITYGFLEGSDYTIDKSTGEISDLAGNKFFFELPFSATHLFENFLAAFIVAKQMGLSNQEIAEAAKTLKTHSLRFELVERNGVTYLNDSYNASLESMRAAFLNIPKHLKPKRKIAILGEMTALGNYAEFIHKSVAKIAVEHFDEFLCFGKGCLYMEEVFSSASRPVKFFTDFSCLKSEMQGLVSEGDFVLIKGSNANQLWRLLEEEKI